MSGTQATLLLTVVLFFLLTFERNSAYAVASFLVAWADGMHWLRKAAYRAAKFLLLTFRDRYRLRQSELRQILPR